MRICGIDPGANGAICVLDSNDPAHIALLDLAKTTPFDASHWLQKQQPDTVWIEDIHSLFGMSAKSNFGFGRNLGLAVAISQIATKGDVAKTVTPKIWQKYVGVTAKGKAIKKQVAEIAQELYPTAELHGKRGGLLDGRSDALMIAHYGLNYKDK
jgi:Holliday junction resolvasome RuvABC endonuclease subunit